MELTDITTGVTSSAVVLEVGDKDIEPALLQIPDQRYTYGSTSACNQNVLTHPYLQEVLSPPNRKLEGDQGEQTPPAGKIVLSFL